MSTPDPIDTPEPALDHIDASLILALMGTRHVASLAELVLARALQLTGCRDGHVLLGTPWAEHMQSVPEADPSSWMALANEALGTSSGHAHSTDHEHHAIVLSTHESGAAAVLILHGPEISTATSIPRLQHWALCLHIVGLRLHEAFETDQLNVAVLQLERTERLQRALFTIADLSNAALDMPALLRGMHDIVRALMYAENFYIALHDGVRDTANFIYYADSDDESSAVIVDNELAMSEIQYGLTWHVIRKKQALRGTLEEIEQEIDGPLQRIGTAPNNWLGVPMVSGDEVRGVLAVQTYTEAVSFSEADQNLLSFVGTHILNALERHRARVELERQVADRTRELAATNEDLHQQVRERERGERLQKALFKVAELSGHDGSLVDYCSALHVIVADLMPATNFYLAMLSDDGRTLSFPYYMDEYQPKPEPRAISRGMTEYVIRQAHAVLIDASQMRALMEQGEVEIHGKPAQSWLGAPLICTRGVMGVLVVQSYSGEVVYAERECELLMFVAYQVANGMQRRRAAEDLRKANAMLELRVEERTRELRRQIEERELIQARLKHQVLHDTLTGLPNRDLLRERLDRALQRLQSTSGPPFALLFIDVDRFKVINDSLGHQAGDIVLIEVARRFESCVRDRDIVARLSGDEFAVLLEQAENLETAMRVAQRIIETIAEPMSILDNTLQPSVSIGIALADVHYRNADDLLRDADAAMYRAKTAGRNRYQVFQKELDNAAHEQIALEFDLRQALLREEFEPWFQAIVELGTGEVVGYEALMRWHHPRRGVMAPGEFLGVADESGLLEAIDWQVFRKACIALPNLPQTQAYITLNVSPRHFQEDRFAERFLGLLDELEVPHQRVRVELTEGTLLRHPMKVRSSLERLIQFGVHTALDDFGTGYSSLSYLHQFPLQMLKIDRSFVTALDEDDGSSGTAIVSAILAMAASLDLQVVAEGIETESQRRRLIHMGCRYGQGFLFARPQRVSLL
ncbi:MAG: EAL domain-containing protein [Lysobacteraceae bacterium]